MERSKSTSRCLISQLCLNQKNRYYYSSKPTGTMLYHVSTIFKASIELLNKINEIVSTSVRSMEHPYERVGTKRGSPFWTPLLDPIWTPSGPPSGPRLDPIWTPIWTPFWTPIWTPIWTPSFSSRKWPNDSFEVGKNIKN